MRIHNRFHRLIIFVLPIVGLNLFEHASGQTASAGKALGKDIYDSRCALCHGVEGKGNGIAAALLMPRPRDFTAGKFKFRTTETGSIPTDADLERVIKRGLDGTSMPAGEPFLRGDSLSSVLAYLKTFSPRFSHEEAKPIPMSRVVPVSPASVAAGQKVYERLECAQCHGVDGEGTGATAADLTDDWGYPTEPTKLTEPWTFRNGSSPSDIYCTVSTGLDGTPMPSFSGSAKGEDVWHLANYVVSIARKPVWEMDSGGIASWYAKLREQEQANPVKRGKYLTDFLGCQSCHTPARADGTLIEELRFAGGQRWSGGPYGSYFTDNLTSDKETGLGNWTDEEIKQAIVRGISKDGRRFLPFYMPWTSLANLNPDDLNAIVAYLRTIEPIHNRVPKPEPLDVFSYLWGKFKMLILHQDFPSVVYPGNAGDAKETASVPATSMNAGGKEASR